MDIEVLTTTIVKILAPFTPFLVELGKDGSKKIVDVISEKGGEASWELAQKIWKKINSSLGEDPEIKGATLIVSAKPEDETKQAVLAETLSAKLRGNQILADELFDIIGGENSIQQIIVNHKSIVADIDQQMSGNGKQIISADNNSRIKGVKQIKK